MILACCAFTSASCSSDAQQGIDGLPAAVSPLGNWSSSATGVFSVLPAGIDRYTVVFKDPLAPRLTMLISTGGTSRLSTNYTATGSQTNARQREIVDYTMTGSLTGSSITGSLRIVRRRSDSGAVFSTENKSIVALKQRHETAAAQP